MSGGAASQNSAVGPDSPADTVFDPAVLDDLATMLDDADVEAYLDLLKAMVVPRVEGMVNKLASGDIAGIVELAHALSGGAACYGLFALGAAARRAETGALSADAEGVARAVSVLSDLVTRSLAAVDEWRSQRLRLRPTPVPQP